MINIKGLQFAKQKHKHISQTIRNWGDTVNVEDGWHKTHRRLFTLLIIFAMDELDWV